MDHAASERPDAVLAGTMKNIFLIHVYKRAFKTCNIIRRELFAKEN